jgi:pyridoxine kinase
VRLNILSIQSWVAYGHVGNAAAVFPLQRLGAEVWAANTVQFSNHTGYGAWTGQAFTGEAVGALVDGIAARGVLASCDGVLSGYMGDAGVGGAVAGAVGRVRAANPRALYCCDPVIGDVGQGVFVRPGIPEFLRDRALPAADLLTPNGFELEFLTGHPCGTLAEAKRAAAALRGAMAPGGPRAVLVTSLRTEETPGDALDLLAADEAGAFRLRVPLLPVQANGAGDVTAALFLYHVLRGHDARGAMEAAAASVHGVLRRTAEAGSAELLLVAAQEEFVAPSTRFRAEAC